MVTESQPAALTNVTLYDPAELYVLPFQVYGNCAGQTLTGVELPVLLFTVRTSVAMESQPDALTSVTLYEPAPLYVFPFHVYGNWEGQMLTGVELKTELPAVRINVAIESQPDGVVI